jgi:PAS domain S-box-containing protein
MRVYYFTKPTVFISLVLGLLLTLLAYNITRSNENKQMHAELDAIKRAYKIAFFRELELNLDILRDIRKFYQSSDQVTRAEFRLFTLEAIQQYDAIKALQWVPRVSAEQKNAFVRQAHTDGLSQFTITQRNAQATMQPIVQAKPFYYPVYFVEPMQGNEQALGFDLSSNPSRYQTILSSIKSGRTLSTPPIQLVQDKHKVAYLFIEPIYHTGSPSPAARQEKFNGFALGVFKIEPLFFSSLKASGIDTKDILLGMQDITDPNHSVSLFTTYASPLEKALTLYQQSINIKHIGRTWRLTLYPNKTFIARHQSQLSNIVLLSGIGFTLVIVSFLYMLISREHSVSLLVQQRTGQLLREQKRSQAILETALNAIITIDFKGAIKSFNPAAQKLFGFQYNEVLNKNVKMLMPAQYANYHDRYLSDFLHTGDAKIIGIGREVIGMKKSGATFPMFLAVDQVDIDDDRIFVGVIADLTQQKEHERRLTDAKDKAEQHSRSKSEFLSMMSHELRTPLTVILGYLPLLVKPDKLPSNVMISEIAHDIKDAGEHLLMLINDVLDISKIEAGRLTLKRQWQNGYDVIQQCLSTLTANALSQNIQLVNQVPDIDVYCDPLRLKQIFFNLLSNAIKFSPNGSITLRAEQAVNSIIFEIQDTGCGIKQEELPYLFEKFYQVDSSSTRAVNGTGLGLAITKRLVELHGGSMSVVSQVGQGSTFTFSIQNAREGQDELNPID